MVKNGHVYEMGKEFKTLAGQLQTHKNPLYLFTIQFGCPRGDTQGYRVRASNSKLEISLN